MVQSLSEEGCRVKTSWLAPLSVCAPTLGAWAPGAHPTSPVTPMFQIRSLRLGRHRSTSRGQEFQSGVPDSRPASTACCRGPEGGP